MTFRRGGWLRLAALLLAGWAGVPSGRAAINASIAERFAFEPGALALPAAQRQRVADMVSRLRRDDWCAVEALIVDANAVPGEAGRRTSDVSLAQRRADYVMSLLRLSGLDARRAAVEGKVRERRPADVEVELIGIAHEADCPYAYNAGGFRDSRLELPPLHGPPWPRWPVASRVEQLQLSQQVPADCMAIAFRAASILVSRGELQKISDAAPSSRALATSEPARRAWDDGEQANLLLMTLGTEPDAGGCVPARMHTLSDRLLYALLRRGALRVADVSQRVVAKVELHHRSGRCGPGCWHGFVTVHLPGEEEPFWVVMQWIT